MPTELDPSKPSKEYVENIDRWRFIDHICDFKEVEQYLILPRPVEEDLPAGERPTTDDDFRNKQYKKRAVFHKVAGNTVGGLLGLIYGTQPSIDLPNRLEGLKKNSDGCGTNLIQHSQLTTNQVIRKGRCGIWVDSPKSEKSYSKAETDAGKGLPRLSLFPAESVIDARFKEVDGQILLGSVRLAYKEEIEVNQFEVKEQDAILHLYLDDLNQYAIQRWIKNEDKWELKKDEVTGEDFVIPTNSKGAPWSYIPFFFGGSQNNNKDIDESPMLGICELNKAHFNNSAEYEDSLFICGQPQYWSSGISSQAIEDMEAKGVVLGSGTLFNVPKDQTLGIVQPEPNTMSRQGMLDKEQAMIAQGAHLITPGSANKTAAESKGEQRQSHSKASLISENIGDLYSNALAAAGEYVGAEVDENVFVMNSDFVEETYTIADLKNVAEKFQDRLIPVGDYHEFLKAIKMRDPESTIEDFLEELESTGNLLIGLEPEMEDVSINA